MLQNITAVLIVLLREMPPALKPKPAARGGVVIPSTMDTLRMSTTFSLPL